MKAGLRDVIRKQVESSKNFRHLVSGCLGAWPISVVEILTEIAADGGELGRKAAFLVDDAKNGEPEPLSSVRGLPVEHPLDSDWRFAPGVPEQILSLLAASACNGRILLACVPTLVLTAARLGLADRITVAARTSDPVCDAVRGLVPEAEFRMFDRIEGLEAASGIIDPPWYDDVAAPLVERVLSGIQEGGLLLICGPDLLTGASNARLLSGGTQEQWTGLATLGDVTRVRYRTPLFEQRALQSRGIRNVSATWRTGLVRHYRRTGARKSSFTPLSTGEGWTEVPSLTGRIWLRPSAASGTAAILTVADTVSRTSLLRSRASAWTSANTVVLGGSRGDVERLVSGGSPPSGDLASQIFQMDVKPVDLVRPLEAGLAR